MARKKTQREVDCLVTLSGGIDSTVLVHTLVKEGKNPLCVYIDYGTTSKDAELTVANETCSDLGLELFLLPLPVYSDIATAFILGNTEEKEPGSMFWLEGRNAVLGLLLAVMASGRGLTEVYMGINYSDNAGAYVDTDARFIASLNMLIMNSCRKEVTVYAPWLDRKMKKTDVILAGNKLGIDWVRTTHSCSSTKAGSLKPCCDYWTCESCVNRREDFEALDLFDPFMPEKEE